MLKSVVGRWMLAAAMVLGLVGLVVPAGALAQEGTARDDLIPLGEAAEVGSYELTVAEVNTDATAEILAENSFNEEPADGNVFVMVRIELTYTGDESGTPGSDLGFHAVGARNVGYSIFSNYCGVIPEDIYSVQELFEGGDAAFNICWEVPEEDAGTLAMYVKDFNDFEAEPVWFSLGLDDEAPSSGSGRYSTRRSEAVDESSRSEPVPFGTAAVVGDYTVRVVAVTPDATEVILEENSFNEEPGQDNQFFMVTVEVAYTGSEIGIPWLDLNFQAVGDEAVSYTEFDDSCGVIPNGGTSVGDLFPTGTVNFNVCWQVDSADADSLVMFVDATWSFDDEARMWFSLDDDEAGS